MNIATIALLSLIFQLAAAVQALRLIRLSGRTLGWVLISVAAVIQGVRRTETLYRIWCGDSTGVNATSEYLGLTISVFLLTGVILIGQLFRDLKNSHDEVQESRSRLELLNSSLESLVQKEVEKNREKDILMLQQGKLASMGEMLRSITHQWKQPLNNLGLMLQALPYDLKLQEDKEKQLQESIDAAMGIIVFLSHTVDDFRNFFKEDRLKSDFSINNVVLRVKLLISASLQEKDIDLIIEGDANVSVLGYPNEYAHVLLNLISNARDVLVERRVSQPRVVVRCFKEGGRAVVTVHDNAGGIAEECLEKIFNPDFTTKEHENGTGLGLYLSRVIVERHMGGKLTVRNSAEGAEFRVEI